MRTLVDIPDSQLQALTDLSSEKKVSRAAVIREAIAEFLRTHPKSEQADAFGLWGGRVDGLEYQEKVRTEW